MTPEVAAALRELVAAIRVLGEQVDRQTGIILDMRPRQPAEPVRRRKVKAAG